MSEEMNESASAQVRCSVTVCVYVRDFTLCLCASAEHRVSVTVFKKARDNLSIKKLA